MARNLPSSAALQAFESAAYHRSITRAAEELHLTQSAVSRQIQSLEHDLGAELFLRQRQRIRLTPAGEQFLGYVQKALDTLEAGALALRSFQRGGGVLHLGILPTFGTRWLIPRLPAFVRAHPAVQIDFATRILPFDFAADDLDAAIHYGEPYWPGAQLDRLFDEEVVVVCSPELRAHADLQKPEQLEGQVLLQITSRPQAWAEWLEARGVRGVDGRRGPRFEHHAMVLQAAIAGLGVAVLPLFAVDAELAAGAVVEPFPGARWRTGKGYWLAYPEARRELPALQAFRTWLLAAVGAMA